MKTVHTLIAIGLLSAASAATYGAVEYARPFAPPTSTELGLSGAQASTWDDLRAQTLGQKHFRYGFNLQFKAQLMNKF